MDIYDAVKARRNVHQFKDEEVSLDKVKRILKAGLQASSAFNEQPWEFVVVTDRELVKELARLKYEHNINGLLASKVPEEEAKKLAGAQRDAFSNSVPVVLIYDKEKRQPVESSWNCITTIWLAACAEGLGMSPAYFAVPGQGPIKETIGIPEGYDIAAILRIGVPEVIPDPKPRKGLDDCLHYNRFGSKGGR
jgi:nitroreductase